MTRHCPVILTVKRRIPQDVAEYMVWSIRSVSADKSLRDSLKSTLERPFRPRARFPWDPCKARHRHRQIDVGYGKFSLRTISDREWELQPKMLYVSEDK